MVTFKATLHPEIILYCSGSSVAVAARPGMPKEVPFDQGAAESAFGFVIIGCFQTSKNGGAACSTARRETGRGSGPKWALMW